MTESAALLKAICQQPEDDAPRLIFADWLDEHNESGRANWIRWQIANPTRTVTLSIDHERKRTINDMTLSPEFAELVPSMLESKFPAGSYEVTRGFVSAVTMRQAVFVRHLRRLFNAHPITTARLIDRHHCTPAIRRT